MENLENVEVHDIVYMSVKLKLRRAVCVKYEVIERVRESIYVKSLSTSESKRWRNISETVIEMMEKNGSTKFRKCGKLGSRNSEMWKIRKWNFGHSNFWTFKTGE